MASLTFAAETAPSLKTILRHAPNPKTMASTTPEGHGGECDVTSKRLLAAVPHLPRHSVGGTKGIGGGSPFEGTANREDAALWLNFWF
ncbi:hypothetical protein [Mesorhizobium silamurunense]|uniref:hypothetical protein n=1 Tax=Mesorhizobium silamurunense TaxID=499528 RepID=UPI00177C7A26|nr:hypothetical protein [Mesorhizobium silamurunense]